MQGFKVIYKNIQLMSKQRLVSFMIIMCCYIVKGIGQEHILTVTQPPTQTKSQNIQTHIKIDSQTIPQIKVKTDVDTKIQPNMQINHQQFPQPTILPSTVKSQIEAIDLQAQKKPDLSEAQLLAEGNADKQVTFTIDPIEQKIIQKQQREEQQQYIDKQQQRMYVWVAEELEQMRQSEEMRTHQIFSFMIQQQLDFKWNPSQNKSRPLEFVVQVFSISGEDTTYQNNPQQENYIEVFTQSQNSPIFNNLGKVYLKKKFIINFFTDYQIIRIRNNCQSKMLIQISLQTIKFVPQKALNDDQLKIPAQKIISILQQLQETQVKHSKTFRAQWSLGDRQEQHYTQILVLTGIELFFILSTAFVQIYCIKNLFDSRLIV